jgi:hypothetical protein
MSRTRLPILKPLPGSNPGTFDPEYGLKMSLPHDSPFFSATTGINKTAIVRERWSEIADQLRNDAC